MSSDKRDSKYLLKQFLFPPDLAPFATFSGLSREEQFELIGKIKTILPIGTKISVNTAEFFFNDYTQNEIQNAKGKTVTIKVNSKGKGEVTLSNSLPALIDNLYDNFTTQVEVFLDSTFAIRKKNANASKHVRYTIETEKYSPLLEKISKEVFKDIYKIGIDDLMDLIVNKSPTAFNILSLTKGPFDTFSVILSSSSNMMPAVKITDCDTARLALAEMLHTVIFNDMYSLSGMNDEMKPKRENGSTMTSEVDKKFKDVLNNTLFQDIVQRNVATELGFEIVEDGGLSSTGDMVSVLLVGVHKMHPDNVYGKEYSASVLVMLHKPITMAFDNNRAVINEVFMFNDADDLSSLICEKYRTYLKKEEVANKRTDKCCKQNKPVAIGCTPCDRSELSDILGSNGSSDESINIVTKNIPVDYSVLKYVGSNYEEFRDLFYNNKPMPIYSSLDVTGKTPVGQINSLENGYAVCSFSNYKVPKNPVIAPIVSLIPGNEQATPKCVVYEGKDSQTEQE